jgi:hypothetical protein
MRRQVYLLEAGLRAFGKKGETAVTKELHQFNNYSVFDPIHANTLTDEEKSQGLGPTGNIQGSHKFMLLDTGKKIVRRNWTELPLTDTVV